MSDFILVELQLLSEKEKKARSIEFDARSTLITGANDTGKSSLVKSIYQTLGAQPATIHPTWKEAQPTHLLKIRKDDTVYFFLKHLNIYAAFDNGGKLLHSFDSVTAGLGPYFAGLVNFHIQLITKQNKTVVPPPAFYLLPFYVDQDKSWDSTWAGFAELSWIKDYRKNMAEYHTGLRPNAYYDLSAKRSETRAQLAGLDSELAVMEGVFARLRKQLSNIEFDIDVSAFEKEIANLIDQSGRLLLIENQLKSALAEIADSRGKLLAERDIVVNAISELDADLDLATSLPGTVECPTCGHEYDNAFAERFSLARDQSRLTEFLNEIDSDLDDLGKRAGKAREEFLNNEELIATINSLLNTKKQDVTLATITANVGRREAADQFTTAMQETRNNRSAVLEQLHTIEAGLRSVENRKRRTAILKTYRGKMTAFLHRLNVFTFPPEAYKQLTTSIAETGSDKPRAMLAYYFAILHTMRDHSDASYFPLVIDSPHQQEQDESNARRMVEFIRDSRPRNTQLVLALVDDMGVKFDGNRIELNEKYHALQQSEYAKVKNNIEPFLDQALKSITIAKASKNRPPLNEAR